jgi:hypothetical protein
MPSFFCILLLRFNIVINEGSRWNETTINGVNREKDSAMRYKG